MGLDCTTGRFSYRAPPLIRASPLISCPTYHTVPPLESCPTSHASPFIILHVYRHEQFFKETYPWSLLLVIPLGLALLTVAWEFTAPRLRRKRRKAAAKTE